MFKIICLLLPVAAGSVLACAAIAQPAATFPNRPIRIIAQFTPGTSTDVMARVVAQRLSVAFNQQVIVENRPGAGAVLGTEIAAKATPDGYTLVAAVSSAFGINPSLYARLPYDAVRDFEPIINLALTPQTLVGSPAAPFKTIKELFANRMLSDAEVKERLNALAFMPVGGTRREFGDFVKAEIAKWGKAVKDSGARVD